MRKWAGALLLLFLLSGCGDAGASVPEQSGEGALSVAARFQAENGCNLQGGSVQVSAGDAGGSYSLDSQGEISVSGLPRSGELLLTLFDRQQEVQGAMTLSFSEGAVIDATTGEDGVGHVTVRTDTTEVALVFVLNGDGGLTCALCLTEDFDRL